MQSCLAREVIIKLETTERSLIELDAEIDQVVSDWTHSYLLENRRDHEYNTPYSVIKLNFNKEVSLISLMTVYST